MSESANTIYNSSLPSIYHRILGKCCYYLDIDQTEANEGSMSERLYEFTYFNGNPKTVALIDYKYPGVSLSDKYSAIQYQIYTSENEYKHPIPFFIVITYLDHNYPVKMYYVIAANKPAREIHKRLEVSNGMWLSIQGYSRFQHLLRNKKWNKEEIINPSNIAAIPDLLIAKNAKLKDLPDSRMIYQLPEMEFSWQK